MAKAENEDQEGERAGSEMIVKHYRDLLIWQKGMDVCRKIHQICSNFPNDQKYILTSQMLRSAISIPSNIAEGHTTGHTKVFDRHLSITLGSIAELETQLILSVDFDYCPTDQFDEITEELTSLKRMVHTLRRSLFKKPHTE